MADGPYVGRWISTLYRAGQSYFNRHFEQYGIGSGHFSFLLCLYRMEGATQEVISKELNVDKATTARAIAALENLNYVYRERDKTDKRALRVYLTEQGRLLEPNIRNTLRDWSGKITADLTEEEKLLIFKLVQRMAENAINAKDS